ncbi:MAG: hypothetical protein JNM39_18670 [Bdellovibrionaceae bacterium]|nr:hypothetical protein [Pseudobdellovibrionaceae bacterium]
MDKELAKKVKELEKAGFKVQKIVPTTKKTFEVPVEVVEKFMQLVKSKDMKVKDAVSEALNDWCTKRA